MKLFVCGSSFTVKDRTQQFPHWAEIVADHLGASQIIWLGKIGCANDMIHSQVEYALKNSTNEDKIIVWLASSGNMSYIDSAVESTDMIHNLNYDQFKQVHPHWSVEKNKPGKPIDFNKSINSSPIDNLPLQLRVIMKYFYPELAFYKDQQTLRSMLYLAKEKKDQLFFIPIHFYDEDKEAYKNYDIKESNWFDMSYTELLKQTTDDINHLNIIGHNWLGAKIIEFIQNFK